MYQTCDFSIKGSAPLLMHNGDLSNPLNPIVKLMKQTTSKRKKTDDDIELLSKLEWLGGLYLTNPITFDVKGNYDILLGAYSGEPCIPSEVIESALIAGAKKFKLGVQAKAGMMLSGSFPLKFKGSKPIAALFEDASFFDVRRVKVQQSAIMRTRPIFREWELDFTINFLPDVLNLSQLFDIVQATGNLVGLCDYRPKYGRFEVVEK